MLLSLSFGEFCVESVKLRLLLPDSMLKSLKFYQRVHATGCIAEVPYLLWSTELKVTHQRLADTRFLQRVRYLGELANRIEAERSLIELKVNLEHLGSMLYQCSSRNLEADLCLEGTLVNVLVALPVSTVAQLWSETVWYENRLNLPLDSLLLHVLERECDSFKPTLP